MPRERRFLKPRPLRALVPAPPGETEPAESQPPKPRSEDPIPKDLAEVRRRLKAGAGGSTDVIIREFEAGREKVRLLLVYVDGLVNKDIIDQHIIAPIIRAGRYGRKTGAPVDLSSPEELGRRVLTSGQIKIVDRFHRSEMDFCAGNTVLFIDGADRALSLDTRGWEKRGIDHPETERSTRASREGFVETLQTNLALIRRRIKDPSLRVEATTVGRRTHTTVAIVWLEGLTNPVLVETVRKRLKAIQVDRVIESYVIEYYLKDDPWTPFPLIRGTERPDFSARELLDGRVLILVEGSPFGLIAPATIADFYRTMDDYVHNYMTVSMTRLVRFVANFLVIFFAAGYVALIDMHPELIPTDLAISIAGSREGVAFPGIIEVVLMLLVFEILHEATLRLPGMMGPTIGVVGGLVIGQAAVQAKIISDVMVIIIAMQAIAIFTPPSLEMSLTWRVLLWGSVLFAGVFGIFGLVLYSIILTAHVSGLTSLGVPFTAPNAPPSPIGQRDNFIRAAFKRLRRRPEYIHPRDDVRRQPYAQPAEHPPLSGGFDGERPNGADGRPNDGGEANR